MNNKKTVILTAIITFIATTVVIIGGYITLSSPLLSLMGIGIKSDYSADSVRRAGAIIEELYYEDVDTSAMYEAALHAMLASLDDEYSWFVNEASFKELMNNMSGEYTGIGVTVSVDPSDNLLTIVAPIEDTPAYEAGIVSGDKIISINGTALSGDNYSEAVSLIRGSTKTVGQEIELVVRRARTGEDEKITIIRQLIYLKTVKSRMLPNNIGYIRITSFDMHTGTEFKEHLAALQSASPLSGLVLDLRNNGGGVLTSLQEIADEVVPEGLITYFENKNGKRTEYNAIGDCLDVPISVLINGSSASAAEVLAGALRDRTDAVLVGEKTFGKGIVQTILPFITTPKGKTAIYLTSSRYYTPCGECIHGIGIAPHIEIALPEEYKDISFDELTMDQDIQLKTAWSETMNRIK